MVSTWPAARVGEWIHQLGLPQYADTFVESHVDGELLTLLTDDDLRDLEIEAAMHRKLLLIEVAKLVEAEAATAPPRGPLSSKMEDPPSVMAAWLCCETDAGQAYWYNEISGATTFVEPDGAAPEHSRRREVMVSERRYGRLNTAMRRGRRSAGSLPPAPGCLAHGQQPAWALSMPPLPPRRPSQADAAAPLASPAPTVLPPFEVPALRCGAQGATARPLAPPFVPRPKLDVGRGVPHAHVPLLPQAAEVEQRLMAGLGPVLARMLGGHPPGRQWAGENDAYNTDDNWGERGERAAQQPPPQPLSPLSLARLHGVVAPALAAAPWLSAVSNGGDGADLAEVLRDPLLAGLTGPEDGFTPAEATALYEALATEIRIRGASMESERQGARRRRRNAAAVQIQTSVRGFLARFWRRSILERGRVDHAASRIQARQRGLSARARCRAQVAERELLGDGGREEREEAAEAAKYHPQHQLLGIFPTTTSQSPS